VPTYSFTCEVCGKPGREWRYEGYPPRFCSVACRSMGHVKARNEKWIITPERHEAIRRLYLEKVGTDGKANIKELAAKLGLPPWKVKRYALEQGWVAKQRKEADWTPEEMKILERHAHKSPKIIRQHLKAAGFVRTETGIVTKRKRMRLLQNLDGWSATQVALGFGVWSRTVVMWIRDGKLKARKRGTARTRQQGGDTYWIKAKWVRNFILEYLPEIDLRKVDKYWFVDLLAGGDMGLTALCTPRVGEEDGPDEHELPGGLRVAV